MIWESKERNNKQLTHVLFCVQSIIEIVLMKLLWTEAQNYKVTGLAYT